MTENGNAYTTTELELASYLKARGHRLIDAKLDGRFVSFAFDDERDAARDVNNYFAGAQVSARDLFESHRSLRALIQQVREHSSHQTGTENSRNDHRTAHRS